MSSLVWRYYSHYLTGYTRFDTPPLQREEDHFCYFLDRLGTRIEQEFKIRDRRLAGRVRALASSIKVRLGSSCAPPTP
jgi:hypothetical protein